jgi:hypothetical protein
MSNIGAQVTVMTRIYISYRSEDADIVQRIYNRAIETYGKSNILLNPEERVPQDASEVGEFLERLGSYRTGRLHGRDSLMDEQDLMLKGDVLLEDVIENLIDSCQVVLLIVGKSWSGVDEFGRFLLSSADVPVGIEVDIALHSRCQVIPVLVNGVKALPPPDEIPEALHMIYETRPVILRSQHFERDIRQLIAPPSFSRRLEYWLTLGWLNRRVTGHTE